MQMNKPDFYQLSFATDRVGDETLKIHKKIVAHFSTLQNMVADLDGEYNIPIPMAAYVTRDVMQWIIDAYTVMQIENILSEFVPEAERKPPSALGPVGEDSDEYILTFDDLNRNLEQYNSLRRLQFTESRPLLTLFGEGGTPEIPDMPLLVSVIETLNYLDGQQLLTITMNRLLELVHSMPSAEIQLLLRDKKRKLDDTRQYGLPTSPHYTRVNLVHEYLTSVLPEDVVGAKPEVAPSINPVAIGKSFDLFLTREGLYGKGSNKHGQLGMPKEIEKLGVLTKLDGPPGLPLLVACGNHHSVCLTTEGLFVTGSNSSGQLGFRRHSIYNISSESEVTDTEDDEDDEDVKVSALPRIGSTFGWLLLPVKGEVLLIEVRGDSTLILTTTGLYGCGWNSINQFGTGGFTETIYGLTLILDRLWSLVAIEMSPAYTVIHTMEGLYSAGDTLNREVRVGKRGIYARNFILLASTKQIGKIQSIAANEDDVLAITDNGLFIWGSSRKEDHFKFTEYGDMAKVDELDGKPLAIYANESYSFLLTTNGLFSSDPSLPYSNDLRRRDKQRPFRKLEGLENAGTIKSVTAGRDDLIVITTEGIYAAGNVDGFPQIAVDDDRFLFTPTFIRLVFDMGYVWSVESFLDKDQSERKERRLDCVHCYGMARLIFKNTPICSKYCVYSHTSRLRSRAVIQ